MYHLHTDVGLDATAPNIPHAIEMLVEHLRAELPHRPVQWTVATPTGHPHMGRIALNGRTDLLEQTLDETAEELPRILAWEPPSAHAAGISSAATVNADPDGTRY